MKRLALALLMACLAVPARAAVIYEFSVLSMGTDAGAPYGVTSVEGTLTLRDAAVAAGSFGRDDISDFAFAVNGLPPLELRTYVPCVGCPPLEPAAEGGVTPAMLTTGHIVIDTGFDLLQMQGDAAGLWAGTFLTDSPADGCNLSQFPCRFTGQWLRVATVAEPVALGAMMLAAAVLVRGRRRA